MGIRTRSIECEHQDSVGMASCIDAGFLQFSCTLVQLQYNIVCGSKGGGGGGEGTTAVAANFTSEKLEKLMRIANERRMRINEKTKRGLNTYFFNKFFNDLTKWLL